MKIRSHHLQLALGFAAAALLWCRPAYAAPISPQSTPATTLSDDDALARDLNATPPIASSKRTHHHFSIGGLIDDITIKPLTFVYKTLPHPIRYGFHNLLRNLDEPDVALNDLLQGHPVHAAKATFRFATNTTLGVAGIFDVAKHIGATHHDNDAATTLAAYGAPDGPRFHLPLAETDNLREAAGFAFDFVIDPVGWAQFRNADVVFAGQLVADAVDDQSQEDSEARAYASVER